MELDVPSWCVSTEYGMCERSILHEGIWYGHGRNDHNVHEKRDRDNALIEFEELIIFLQPVVDKIFFDGFQEVPVESRVDDEVHYFLDAVPYFIDSNVSI